MRGTRPLNNEELLLIANACEGRHAARDKSLFVIGFSTGGRISELLSLKLGDVYQNDKPVETLHFNRQIVKGKESSRSVPVNSDGVNAISKLINYHIERFGSIDVNRPCFPTQGKGNVSITRQRAHQILKDVFVKAGLNGNLATHSLRKSYAQRLYGMTGDIYAISEMLGHKNVNTTRAYLGVDIEKIKLASEAMTIGE